MVNPPGSRTRPWAQRIEPPMLKPRSRPSRKSWVAASTSEDRSADAKGEFLAPVDAQPVYHLFDERDFDLDQFPACNRPLRGHRRDYDLRPGAQDITPGDGAQYLKFANRQLKRLPRL